MDINRYLKNYYTIKESLQKKDLKFALIGIKILIEQLFINLIPIKSVECILCGYKGYRFDSVYYYKEYRKNAKCPNCGCYERHRLLAYYLLKIKDSLPEKKLNLLEIAPTKSLLNIFKQIGNINHIMVDLHLKMYFNDVIKCDLTKHLPFPDDYFDVIICYHVLEHIQNDEKTLINLKKVLNPSGFCIFQVPITSDKTIEYGFADESKCGHVRSCGYDYYDRLEGLGFLVEFVKPDITENKKETIRHGFYNEEKIAIIRKILF